MTLFILFNYTLIQLQNCTHSYSLCICTNVYLAIMCGYTSHDRKLSIRSTQEKDKGLSKRELKEILAEELKQKMI